MQPFDSRAPGASRTVAGFRSGVIRVVCVVALALICETAVAAPEDAESSEANSPTAGASNGGVATTTSGGTITIDHIVTGENAGNSIATGDISGPAEINGGEIDYPTEVTLTQIDGPQSADASGGAEGTANSSDDHSQAANGKNSGKGGEDITVINRNDNRSKATVKEE